MKSLTDALLEYRHNLTDNDAFHSVSSSGFKKAVKVACAKYVSEYSSHDNSTNDFLFVYEYSSFLGFIQGFAITDYCIYGDEGGTFQLPLSELRSVKYDNDDNEIVFVPQKGLSYYVKVDSRKKGIAKELVSLINDYI